MRFALLIGPTTGIIGALWFLLVVVSIINILFGDQPRSLNRLLWLIIVLFLPVIGVILYWILR